MAVTVLLRHSFVAAWWLFGESHSGLHFIYLLLFTHSGKPEVVQSSSSAKHNRNAPSEGAQRAGAAALARIEQQHRPKVHTSQDAIRNQGETYHSNNTDGLSETNLRLSSSPARSGTVVAAAVEI